MHSDATLKAPFTYPGGKSRVADLVWFRLGNVENYIEPFAGTLAVLLRRPASHFAGRYRVETANDANHYLCNFWRAVRADPDRVAEYADWIVTEADLHARHRWLVRSAESAEFRRRVVEDPNYYDPRIAGWWVWGMCCWIGPDWCRASPGGAVHTGGRPQLADAFDIGRGVNGGGSVGWLQIPELSTRAGRGVTANRSVRTPHRHGLAGVVDPSDVADGVAGPWVGICDARRAWLTDWMRRLADRLRLVRTCYGHWSRICDSVSTMTRHGLTGVFLDPPYPIRRADTGERSRAADLYATDSRDLDALRDEVLAWCRRWGGSPQVRVALCCYEGDGYEPLAAEGWDVVAWETSGGYGNQRKGGGKAENAKRERIYFSPACHGLSRPSSLFDGGEGVA
jgi:DNA adenine methylase